MLLKLIKKFYSEWHKDPKNVQRTQAIVKRIAVMFKDRTGVVSAITALNELVYPLQSFSISDLLHIHRPFGAAPGLLSVLKTVRQALHIILLDLTYFIIASSTTMRTVLSGSIFLTLYYHYHGNSMRLCRWPYGTSQQSKLVIIISDAFQATSYWHNWMPYPNWDGVIIDTHIYQVFSNYVSPQLSFSSYI